MGIFSRKKKTYVSSVAYPMGEDDGEHTPFLKYTVLNGMLQGLPMAENITQSYLRGQGISLRSAFRYARDHYTDGVPESNVSYSTIPDIEELRDILELEHPGTEIEFFISKISSADFLWWGDKYLAETYGYDPYEGNFATPPVGVDVDAAVAYDVELSGDIIALMVNADTSTYDETFTPAGLVRMKDYVHASYRTSTTVVDGPTVTTRDPEEDEVDHIDTDVIALDFYTEETTVIEVVIEDGVATVTTTITTVTKSRPKFWMYQIGLGTYPVLDSWLSSESLDSPYYPSIPIRVNNVDFTDEAHQDTDLYKTGKRYLSKLGVDIEKIAESVNDNEDIDEIDFCYAVFGVSLNAESQECRRYLYRFFEHLLSISSVNQAAFDAWDPDGGGTPPTNILKIHSGTNRDKHHDIEIQWQYINTSVETGTVFTGAKPKDCMVAIEGDREEVNVFNLDIALDKTALVVTRQIDADTYSKMVIIGLTYENFVYNGKSVNISAYDALIGGDDEDEEPDEGFIIPLNYEIIRNTPMVELTDLAYQINHLVFNCYKIVKQKWYQTGLFKIIVVIIAILIIIFTWGGGTPVAAQMLATVFIGAGIGATLAIVLAATIYVLGMMILMNIIAKVAIKLFGPKWGPLIALIVSFIAMNWGNITNLITTFTNQGMSAIITAQTVLQATTFVSNAYAAYAAGQLSELQKKAMGLWTQFDEQMKEIERLTELNLNSNLDMIDVMGFTNASFLQMFESYDSFLNRTLLTGSDICEITSGLVENFTEVGLYLPTT